MQHFGTPWRLSICPSQYEKVDYHLDPTSTLTAGEKQMILEIFLNGLPQWPSESSALRLVATEEVANSVDKMAKRAYNAKLREL